MRHLIPIAERIAARLRARGETVAVAESSTGGLISAALLAVPGASDYFLGGGVIYTRIARYALLGLSDDAFVEMRSATEPYALVLARTAQMRLEATWGLGESGAAGPTGNRYGDAPGHMCAAVAGPDEASETIETASADRTGNMRAFAVAAMALLERHLG